MAKALLLGFVVAFAAATGALAQATASRPAASNAAHGGPGIRAGHITATGETVPNPGAPQSGGTSALDRNIQREDSPDGKQYLQRLLGFESADANRPGFTGGNANIVPVTQTGPTEQRLATLSLSSVCFAFH